MAGYEPLNISGNTTGLVQNRENFLLPADAYPILENAYVWRERIKRKQAYELLGRLRRLLSGVSIGNTGDSPWTFNIFSVAVPPITETNATLEAVAIVFGGITFTDNGNGTLTGNVGGNSGIINYSTGSITLIHTAGEEIAAHAQINYFPNLPVMGIRIRELQNAVNDQTVFFDQVYAYIYNSGISGFQEFIPGTTWTGTDSEFFWSTNYWVNTAGNKIFWVTNFSVSGDPIRYTDSVSWVPFSPIIDAVGNTLNQCLAMIPFRGRMVVFNTRETTGSYSNRIRWAAIGTPFTTVGSIAVNINANAWRDDIRGQGGFLDIPTSQDIVSVGFVRDNLVIYCEQSTWQLRYTGRSIAPFQIEKVNSEIGSTGTFSSIQFDTSLLCVGDKGIVECDSFTSTLIDVKIPDFVFDQVSHSNNGPSRVHGIRDFINRLAYWTYPASNNSNGIFPNSRLVYNYENESWAIFTDSLTTLGTFQVPSSRNWLNTHKPWIECNFPWISTQVVNVPDIIGGNQQGFIEYLDSFTTNDASLFIDGIIGHVTTSTELTSPNHNLQTGNVISISGIPSGTPFDNLNDKVFGVVVSNANTILLNIFDPSTVQFSLPQLDANLSYVGKGLISVRDNFSIVSKKFSFVEQGQNIQMGYIDILMDAIETPDGQNPGAIGMNVYLDYNDSLPINTIAENVDTFFNSIIPTSQSNLNTIGGSKFWQRVICPCRGNFLTIQYTFTNAQMAGIEQEYDVQIDSQTLWVRRAGRLTQF